MAEKAAGKQRGRPFRKGQSGNPAGKQRGTRHKATLAIEALLDGGAERLTRKAIEKALEGDGVALRLCLDRLCPPRKDRPVSFTLPKIESAHDAAKATAAILAGVAHGQVTPSEAAEVGRLVETHVKTLEVSDLERRITELEKRRGQKAMSHTTLIGALPS
jgi:Family of unknown function (DUF5681)